MLALIYVTYSYTNHILFCYYTYTCVGYPTNEERLIVGLGLGGSGHKMDSSLVLPPIPIRTVNASYQDTISFSLKQTFSVIQHSQAVTAYVDSGTRCPHKDSAGEVCQDLSGMSMLKLYA